MLASMSAPEAWSDLGVSELPTGTVTLLLADVEGSTRLWETQPDEMTAALARLNGAVTDLVSSHGGVRPVEQGEGDSFVVAFARASDAVACALELQRAPLAPIRLRIGVHTGQIQLRDEGNYAGPTINRTARLRDLGHGGQTLLSGATEPLVVDWLPEDAWLTDLGTHPLRDLPRPERVVQLCHPDICNDFPPLRTSKSVETPNLPVQLTSFIGRGAQMDDVRRLLGDNRLVNLTGAGGAGKTRLAVEIAARFGADFPDGVHYVDLAPVTHPEVVPVAVARAARPARPARPFDVDSVVRSIGERRMLMVVDNCEHLLEPVAAAGDRAPRRLPSATAARDQPRAARGTRRGDLPGAVAVDRRRGDRPVRRPRPPDPARFRCHREQFGHSGGDLQAPRRDAAGHRTGGGAGHGRCRWTTSSAACTTGSGC